MTTSLLGMLLITLSLSSLTLGSGMVPNQSLTTTLSTGFASIYALAITAPAQSVFIIFPNTSGKPGIGNCAPLNANIGDWAALGFLMGQLINPQDPFFDTDSSVWTSGAPVGTDRVYVAFGGPLVNNFVCFYEAAGTPVQAIFGLTDSDTSFSFKDPVSKDVLTGTAGDFSGLPLKLSTSSAGTSGEDLFMLEAFRDPSTRNVFFFAYGFTFYGSFAAGVFLKFIKTLANQDLTHTVFIVEWSGVAGLLPAASDTYTIVLTLD